MVPSPLFTKPKLSTKYCTTSPFRIYGLRTERRPTFIVTRAPLHREALYRSSSNKGRPQRHFYLAAYFFFS